LIITCGKKSSDMKLGYKMIVAASEKPATALLVFVD